MIEAALQDLDRHCRTIDRIWSDTNYDLNGFADIVLAETGQLDLSIFGRIDQLARAVALPQLAPLQRPSSFSDLYVKLWDNGRFWVEVLNWWGSDINIHDHDFAGVQFQLSGRSLNVQYAFSETDRRGGLHIGEIIVTDAEVWLPGERSVVAAGRGGPHNVCHIDVPTVSLLIRTHPVPALGPQWNYFPPKVAGSYGVADAVFRKQVKALRLMNRAANSLFKAEFRRHMAQCSPAELLFSLVKMVDILFEPENVDLVHDLAGTDDCVRHAVVEAVIYYHAVETLKHVKNTSNPDSEARAALSVVASAFDRAGIEKILQCLHRQGREVELERGLQQALAKAGAGNGLQRLLTLLDAPLAQAA